MDLFAEDADERHKKEARIFSLEMGQNPCPEQILFSREEEVS